MKVGRLAIYCTGGGIEAGAGSCLAFAQLFHAVGGGEEQGFAAGVGEPPSVAQAGVPEGAGAEAAGEVLIGLGFPFVPGQVGAGVEDDEESVPFAGGQVPRCGQKKRDVSETVVVEARAQPQKPRDRDSGR
ncbi:hypothetical protein ACQ86N_14790 [Puia sp. P3]|uniref:hypothetical protein n=1 Tax=Puia sp. P3 TaxID=3423952 RepID=UPI003D6716C5